MKRSDIYTLMEARCLPTEAVWRSETNMGDGKRFSPKQSHNQVPMMHPSPTPHSNHPTCVSTSDAEAAVCWMCKKTNAEKLLESMCERGKTVAPGNWQISFSALRRVAAKLHYCAPTWLTRRGCFQRPKQQNDRNQEKNIGTPTSTLKVSKTIVAPVEEVYIRDFTGGLGEQFWAHPYSIKSIVHCNSY